MENPSSMFVALLTVFLGLVALDASTIWFEHAGYDHARVVEKAHLAENR